MDTCTCDNPIPCADTARCLKCAKPCVAALVRPKVVSVDPLDALLTYRRRVGLIARAN